ncbi:DEAD/DEAH box helicase [Thioflavicoccus mobilis]|nr:DEAD/DEAH box helicase [Thioflavicoccus mobilis]
MDSLDVPADFSRLGLAPAVLQAVQALGYETPTGIQAQCIPHLLAGRDLLGQAQTGTGKTAAFALPVLSRISVEEARPQVLVLTPTRELALQVAEAFQSYAQCLRGFHVLPLYGGQSYGLQIRQLGRGPHVIVGTPGRIMDHLRRGTLSLDGIRTLVLDEADEMLNMGFAEDIDWIFAQAPAERQVALFSATMPPAIRRVAQTHLREPVEIKVAARSETVDTIEQHHCLVTRYHKLDLLTRVLEIQPFDAILIFVRTKTETVELAERLCAHGFAAEALNGDMNQVMRERTVERFRDGRLDILVATDVAARGLDVERVNLVVNYDIPNDPAAYVHRIGRTGRAGRAGRAVLFVEPRERGLLRAIERTIRQSVPAMDIPSAEAVSESRIGRFTEDLRTALADQDMDFFYRLVGRIAHEQELEVMDIAAALAYLVQRERPLVVAEVPQPRIDADRRGRRDRPDRAGRDPRAGHGPRERRGPRETQNGDAGLVAYRIEVGRRDGVGPREIVGAIANEAGIDGRQIGRIAIRDDHSLVDLPAEMPRALVQQLQRVYVCGKALQLHPAERGARGPERDDWRGGGNDRFGQQGRPEGRGAGKGGRPGRFAGDRPPRSKRFG